MTTEPLVSIVIPCYNAEKYVGETLDSALRQTYAHYEIVVINDGSTDHSAEILNDYAQRFPKRIRVFDQDNQGVAHARMRAVVEARGEFTVALDADDLLHPEALQTWIAYWQANPQFVLIYNPFYRVDSQGTIYAEYDPSKLRGHEALEGHILPTLLIENPIMVGCIIRRDKLLEVNGYLPDDPELESQACEDYLCHLRLLLAGYEFGYVPRFLTYHRNTPGSISKNRAYMIESQIAVLVHLVERHPKAMSQAWFTACSQTVQHQPARQIAILQRAADERLALINEQARQIAILQCAADERLALINDQASQIAILQRAADERLVLINEQASQIAMLQRAADERLP